MLDWQRGKNRIVIKIIAIVVAQALFVTSIGYACPDSSKLKVNMAFNKEKGMDTPKILKSFNTALGIIKEGLLDKSKHFNAASEFKKDFKKRIYRAKEEFPFQLFNYKLRVSALFAIISLMMITREGFDQWFSYNIIYATQDFQNKFPAISDPIAGVVVASLFILSLICCVTLFTILPEKLITSLRYMPIVAEGMYLLFKRYKILKAENITEEIFREELLAADAEFLRRAEKYNDHPLISAYKNLVIKIMPPDVTLSDGSLMQGQGVRYAPRREVMLAAPPALFGDDVQNSFLKRLHLGPSNRIFRLFIRDVITYLKLRRGIVGLETLSIKNRQKGALFYDHGRTGTFQQMNMAVIKYWRYLSPLGLMYELGNLLMGISWTDRPISVNGIFYYYDRFELRPLYNITDLKSVIVEKTRLGMTYTPKLCAEEFYLLPEDAVFVLDELTENGDIKKEALSDGQSFYYSPGSSLDRTLVVQQLETQERAEGLISELTDELISDPDFNNLSGCGLFHTPVVQVFYTSQVNLLTSVYNRRTRIITILVPILIKNELSDEVLKTLIKGYFTIYGRRLAYLTIENDLVYGNVSVQDILGSGFSNDPLADYANSPHIMINEYGIGIYGGEEFSKKIEEAIEYLHETNPLFEIPNKYVSLILQEDFSKANPEEGFFAFRVILV